jgi:murein DD-endopeptidase MepM/ murein hydrolase activator NlpD
MVTHDPHRMWFVEPGLALPYPLHKLLQGWSPCPAAGTHRGLDIAGLGPDAGLGTPVRAVTDAEVLEIGLPAEDPARFGTPLSGGDEVVRAGVRLPATREVPGYGAVRFFTADHGSMRTGALLKLRILTGPLARHTAIYMHLAAVHPDVKIGGMVRAGQEVGLLGGTAVQNDPPHLHFEVRSPRGEALDPGRILKFGPTSIYCHDKPSTRNAQRLRFQVAADALMARLGETASAQDAAGHAAPAAPVEPGM